MTISIITILTAIVSLNFSDVRAGVRDESRKAELEQLQVAIELYKAQYGYYPAEGCNGVNSGDTPSTADWNGRGSVESDPVDETWTSPGPVDSAWGSDSDQCDEYISGLTPDFIAELPTDPNQEMEVDKGYMYKTNSTGGAYKVLVYETVESEDNYVTSYDDPLFRCSISGTQQCELPRQETTYGVYSSGAEGW